MSECIMGLRITRCAPNVSKTAQRASGASDRSRGSMTSDTQRSGPMWTGRLTALYKTGEAKSNLIVLAITFLYVKAYFLIRTQAMPRISHPCIKKTVIAISSLRFPKKAHEWLCG